MTEPGAPIITAQGFNRPATTTAPSRLAGLGGMLMGGLLGASLLGLISGSSPFESLTSFASFLGFLVQIALIAVVVRLIVNFLRRRTQPALARVPENGSSSTSPRDLVNRVLQILAPNGGVAGPAPSALTIGPKDYDRFEKLLRKIQAAYGREDTDALGAMTTPEMLSYLSQDLAENAKNGVRNELSDARFLQGDLSEAWHEAGSDYATVAMRYSLVDAMVDRATDRVVSGDRVAPHEVTEVWTFRRDDRAPEQGWQLSAIQQVESKRHVR